MSELLAGTGYGVARERKLARPLRIIRGGENLVVAAALAAMAIVPLAEFVLRATLRLGIPGSSSVVQHLTLAVGLLGGAIAAREGRLLSLSTGATLVAGRLKPAVRMFTGATSAAISLMLCAAGVQLVLSEKEGGKILAGGVPVWVAQMLIPIGFGLVALRLLRAAGDSWRGWALTGLLAAVLCAVGFWAPFEPSAMVIPALAILAAATILGAPVFAVLGGAALILFWGSGGPVAAIPVEMYRLVVSPTLPMIPLFTLAGYFLSEGGAPARLVRVFTALTGWVRGGPVLVAALACAFFTSFTGASGVTILALGGLLMPVLLAAHYSEKNALGILTSAGSLGLLFPPSLPVILYGIVSHTPIDSMFLGGFLPGVLMVVLTALWGRRLGTGRSVIQKFSATEAAAALYAAKWEMLLPVVALVGLFGGFATQVEAAALTALYAFVIETFVYKDLKLTRDTLRVMTECVILVGGVLLILGVALGFTSYLVDAEVPAAAVAWVKGSIESPLVFLLLLNLFLLVVGCLMDIFSAIVVVVPLIAPMGAAFGIDPVHLGVIFLANMELGYLTPPVGMNLFLSSYRFGKPLSEVYVAVIPMLLVLLVGVLLITYIPAMTTMLPRLFGH